VNGVNIILNLLFIYGFGMKSNGVALGTLCAQYLGLFFAVLLFLKSYRGYIIPVKLKELLEIVELKKFFNVNFDIFIRTLCLITTFSFFTAKSAEFGEGILAANTILLQLWMILSYGVDGFAFAAESLVGNFKGEGDRLKLKKVVKLIFTWGFGLAALVALVYGVFSRNIISIYTDKPDIIELAMNFFAWTLIAPFINSIAFIWDGIFIGATETKVMRNSVLISTLIFFLPVFYLTKGWIGNHGLWLAMISFMFMRGVSLTLYQKTIFQPQSSK
jgi:MATE family multidrug resistance protein